MVKRIVLACAGILHVLIVTCMMADQTSQTFFVPRSFITDSVYEQTLNNYRFAPLHQEKLMEHSKSVSMFSLQPLYAASDNDDALARYFLLNGKTSVRFKGVPDATSDVASEHFGLTAPQTFTQVGNNVVPNPSRGTFDSTLSIQPTRDVYGAIFGIQGNLDQLVKGASFELRVPIVHVRHDLDMTEPGKNALSSSEPNTIIEALNQSSWNYGKFSTKVLTKEGLDDILFRFGYSFNKNRLYLKFYGDFIAPLGDGPTAQFIFEPVVGSPHPGLGGGGMADWNFHRGRTTNISLVIDARYHYRFEAREMRSFDLKNNGPWSRYLLLARRGGAQPLDGINFFTRSADVTPRGSFQALGILHLQHINFHVEGGYNFYARSAEAIDLHDKWDQAQEDIGIYSKTGFLNETASTLTINDQPDDIAKADNDQFIRITEEDFDRNSAAHPFAATHKFFAGISASYSVFDYPGRLGIASSYEIAHSNTALRQWSLWFNATIQF